MKKALLLMALFAGSLLSANAQTAAPVTAFVKPGTTQWLAIQLNIGGNALFPRRNAAFPAFGRGSRYVRQAVLPWW